MTDDKQLSLLTDETLKEDALRYLLSPTGKRGSKVFFRLALPEGEHKFSDLTFLIRRKDEDTPIWFVRYLNGPDPESHKDYHYLGVISAYGKDVRFRPSKGSPSKENLNLRGFNWFFNGVLKGPVPFPEKIKFLKS